MKNQVIQPKSQFNLFKTLYLALRRLKIKSLDLYSYFKSRINRTSHRRRSSNGTSFVKEVPTKKTSSLNFKLEVNSNSKFVHYIKYMHNWRRAAYTSVVLLTLTTLAILFPISFRSATPAEATPGTISEATLTFNSIKPTASVSLNVSDPAGTFATSSTGANNTTDERASFSISTNNATGYKVFLKTNGTNTLGSTINPISTAKTVFNFELNKWGLLPSMYNSESNTTNYYPASSDGFKMNETSNANSNNGVDNPNTYTVGLGLKADYTIPAGTYDNSTIIVQYIANEVNYSISYNKGSAATNPSNMPSTQSGNTSSNTITLSNTVPTLAGYTFTGWCMGTISTSNTKVDTCTGNNAKTFSAGGSFGIDQTLANNATTLYAMWSLASVAVTVNFAGSGVTGVTFTNSIYGNQSVSTSGGTANLKYGVQYTISGTYSSGYEFDSWFATAGTLGPTSSASTTYSTIATGTITLTGKKSIVYTDFCTENGIADSDCLQKMSYGSCTTTAKTVTDSRDGKTYGAQRLADDNCWLLDNLALDLTDPQVQINLTNTTTNASNTTLGYLKSGGGSSPYTNYAVAAATSTGYYDRPAIAKSGTCNNAYCVNNPSSGNWKWDAVTSATINGVTSKAQGQIGVYYNYCAASAGSYCYTSSAGPSSDPDTSTLQDVKEDICPKGWRLPTGSDSGEYKALYTAYSSNYTNFQTALSTPLSGWFYSGKAYDQGSVGYFWSSTWGDSVTMYGLYVGSASAYPNGFARGWGSSVRCVLDVHFMQDDSTVMASLMPNNGDSATLVDKRDGKDYTVKKINGQYWMTQNLRYLGDTGSVAGTMTIGNNNSNVSNKSITLYSLDSSDTGDLNGPWLDYCAMYKGPNNACVYDSGNVTTGVWYNYYAASAGTISGDSNSTVASSDICPKNWRLPTGPNTTVNTDFNKLVGNTTSGYQAATAGLTAFNAVAGGTYESSGHLEYTYVGNWWSASADTASMRFYLVYNSNNGQFRAKTPYGRYRGMFVRCVRSS